MRRVVLSVVFTGTLIGCVTVSTLQRESARVIIPTPYPDSVRISELRRGMQMTRWIATTPSGVYDCSMQADESRPICAKREPQR
jgi:hypothetical protein